MPRPKKEKPNHGNFYEVKITIGKTLDGKLIRKSFYSSISKADAKRQAEEWRVAQKVSEQTGESFITKDVTFAVWAKKWLETYKRPNVRGNTYHNSYDLPTTKHLIPYFGAAKLKDILPADIQHFYEECCSGYSESHIKKITLCLKGIFSTAVMNNLIVRSPMIGVESLKGKPPEEKRTYTKDQIKVVKKFCYTHKFGLEILLLLELGLRRSELLALRWEDFDLKERTVKICRVVYLDKNKVCVDEPKTPKSKRILPISKELSGCLSFFQKPSGYVFSNAKGEPFSPDNWSTRHYNVFMRDLHVNHPDIPTLSPHELRHTCGTYLYETSKDIYAVSKFLGHADISITSKIYVHSSPDTLRENLGI